jgi:hypothetical protein
VREGAPDVVREGAPDVVREGAPDVVREGALLRVGADERLDPPEDRVGVDE